jgi:hypothetical protein
MHSRTLARATALALAALITATVLGGIAEIAATQYVTAMAAHAPAAPQLAGACGCQRKG